MKRLNVHRPPRREPLSPDSHDDVATLFELLCETMRTHLVGNDGEVERLALLGVRHLARNLTGNTTLLRALITGPRASGKSSLAKIFAESLGVPHVIIPASAMAEMNWSGSDVGDFLGVLYDSSLSMQAALEVIERAERAVVVVDDLEALRLPGRYGSASTRDYQLGRQQGLRLLFEGGVIPIERGTKSMFWSSRRALVIGVGAFEGFEDAAPNAEDLVDWGMIPALADHLCSGAVIHLRDASSLNVVPILEQNLSGPKAAFTAFGYNLEISREVLTFVADSMKAGHRFGSVREAIACIALSAEQVLIAMVREGAPAGTSRVLAPDDIRLPAPARGLWRD